MLIKTAVTTLMLLLKAIVLWILVNFIGAEDDEQESLFISFLKTFIITLVITFLSFLFNQINLQGFYSSMFSNSLKFSVPVISFFTIKFVYKLSWKTSFIILLLWGFFQFLLGFLEAKILGFHK
ncbi:MAG TPA: hypothetical protein ENL20_09800 [Candidatus Cloacimonetes bacterium]|nr:hypothetical protein [Candidatus Cloacimonadota bacterium]